jgi:hypothetical protein
MENVNMNAPLQAEVIDVPTSQEPEIHLEGLETYRDIISKLKTKLSGLIQEGIMSETVANRIIDEFSYNAFQQAVKVKYE